MTSFERFGTVHHFGFFLAEFVGRNDDNLCDELRLLYSICCIVLFMRLLKKNVRKVNDYFLKVNVKIKHKFHPEFKKRIKTIAIKKHV